MPIGKPLDAHDEFRLALGEYHKTERLRAERCLVHIVEILGNSDEEHKQVESILQRLTLYYGRGDT